MRVSVFALSFVLIPGLALAGPVDFKTGPIIDTYGAAAPVAGAVALDADTQFKIAFDTATASSGGGLNKTLESAARFLNMHGAVGVDADQIDLAVVVHGSAAMDVLGADAFAARHDGTDNPNIGLINALSGVGVRVILCGQTAAYRDIETTDLAPGVEMALSAMTAHAQLQQDGYTLNPF